MGPLRFTSSRAPELTRGEPAPVEPGVPRGGRLSVERGGEADALAEQVCSSGCVHCGLPLPSEPVWDDVGRPFCCSGCLTVFGVLGAAGLEDFYRLRGDARGARAEVSGRRFEELDDPGFLARHVRRTSEEGGRVQAELFVEGVHCSACIWLVERLPRFVSGVVRAELDYGRRIVRVEYAPERVRLSAIARGLDRLGYPPHPVRGQSAREARRREERRELVRLGVAGALAMNAMLIAFALYGGILSGMEADMRLFLRGGSLLLALGAVLGPGRTFLRGGWVALRTRTAHMDLPIALGLVAGVVGGAVNTALGIGEVYFESVALLVFFLLVGRYLQGRQQRSAQDALELLHALTPARARRIDSATGVVREVPSDALEVGDRLELRAGDLVPADAILEVGTTTVDRALLSGESRPVPAEPGDALFAGCTNLAGRVEARVTAVGAETRIGGLMALVQDASAHKAPSVRFADRMAGRFTWTLLGLAAVTLALWWPRNPAAAIEHAVALLIVACPCALGLATPLAIVAAVGKAAKRGILVQGGAALERLSRPGRIFLDKTGTLTEPRPVARQVLGDAAEAAWIHALEQTSSHPLALAVCAALEPAARAQGAKRELVLESVEERLGRGLVGTWHGAEVAVGSPALLAELGVDVSGLDLDALLASGATPVLAARDGRLVAAFAVGSPLFADAKSEVARLRERGWRVGILSGDHPEIAKQVGAALGLDPGDVRGGVTPEGKLAAVEAALAEARDAAGEEQPAPVVMVGDGVNDAAALAAATVGVAVCGGAEASMAAAEVYMGRPGLGALGELLDGAARTRGVVRRGLSASLVYNSTAALLAMAGLINPIWAAILMPLSSLTVVSLAYRSRTFDGQG